MPPLRYWPDILSVASYTPGKPIEELERELGVKNAIKLASNENPLGPSPKAVEALRRALAGVHRYPEGRGTQLRAKLADRLKVSPEEVILGNGSNEIIELLVRGFITAGDDAVMADLTFSLYPLMVTVSRGRPVTVPLKESRHDLQAMASAVTPKTRLVFICNPNNPTGTMVTAAELSRFLDALPDSVVVVIDEAYVDYVTAPDFPRSLELLRSGPPVIVLRTFSKLHGLAALRIGYGIARRELIAYLDRIHQPFNTNGLAQLAAAAALEDEAHLAASRRVNEEGKASLYALCTELGWTALPTQANFIYVETGRDAKALYEALLREGVIVRHIEGSRLRITVGRPEENQRFAEAVKTVLSGRQ
ncbi:MAG TPA: histidinol-phosphate transaminase [Nitrospiria bacterium]|nr:histidinol-phosphate transaminase [Nitrospiria bacterium]